jgi:hypothetical protein
MRALDLTVPDEDLVAAWQQSETIADVVVCLAEVAQQRGLAPLTAAQVNYKGFRLRKSGVALKRLRRGRPPGDTEKFLDDEQFVELWNGSGSTAEALSRLGELAAAADLTPPSRTQVGRWAGRIRRSGVKLRRMPPLRPLRLDSTRARALQLYQQGLPQCDIALATGVSRQRVSQIVSSLKAKAR